MAVSVVPTPNPVWLTKPSLRGLPGLGEAMQREGRGAGWDPQPTDSYLPKPSMYGMHAHIDSSNHPNASKYAILAIHGWSGLVKKGAFSAGNPVLRAPECVASGPDS